MQHDGEHGVCHSERTKEEFIGLRELKFSRRMVLSKTGQNLQASRFAGTVIGLACDKFMQLPFDQTSVSLTWSTWISMSCVKRV